jgi:hypothetical protein
MATKKARTSKHKTVRQVQTQQIQARACGEDFNSEDAINRSSDRKMPWFGWLGLAIMILSEILLWTGNHPVAVAFTPVMWTGYILLVDGWIWARGGKSYFLDDKFEWPMLALFSILIWVMFEMFNLSAWAWSYYNRPHNRFVEGFVFAWAFATIIPALLRTRSLFATFSFFDRSHPWKVRFTPFWQAVSFVAGLALTFIPVMFNGCTQETLESCMPNILVWMVWFGFIFLIEPINYRLGAPSVFCHLEEGKVSFFWQVLAAGLFCGLLWESWNIQAAQPQFQGLTWNYHLNHIYLIPSFDQQSYWRIGKMPILGFLGYPPFIWECFALWELCKWALQGDHLWKGAK